MTLTASDFTFKSDSSINILFKHIKHFRCFIHFVGDKKYKYSPTMSHPLKKKYFNPTANFLSKGKQKNRMSKTHPYTFSFN